MAKSKKSETKPMMVENPPPEKKEKVKDKKYQQGSAGTSTGFPRDIQFLGEALVRETNRINELELSLEQMRLDLNKVLGRMGL